MNDDVVVEKPLTPIAEYNQTAAALADLQHRFKGVVFDVATRDGMQTAIKGRAELRGYRVSLEKKRVEIKAPALERTRLIDAEARRLSAELSALEDPIDQAIKSEETRKERERAEREAAELTRVAKINDNLAKLNETASRYVGKPSAEIAATLETVRAHDVKAWAQEFEPVALDAKARAIAALEQLHAGALAQETAAAEEAARIKAEREELARLRAEQAERDRTEQARIAEETRKRAEEAAAARAKIETEERASRARIEEENRVARLAREEEERKAKEAREAEYAAIKAERDKNEAEASAQAEAARKAREAEDARQAAERKRLDDEARALAEQQRAAKEREEAAQRELERQQSELLDGAAMLTKFVERFGKRREFKGVVAAITAYLAAPKKEAA